MTKKPKNQEIIARLMSGALNACVKVKVFRLHYGHTQVVAGWHAQLKNWCCEWRDVDKNTAHDAVGARPENTNNDWIRVDSTKKYLRPPCDTIIDYAFEVCENSGAELIVSNGHGLAMYGDWYAKNPPKD